MAEQPGSLPFFVRALYPFRSEEASGLTFDRGDIIDVLACLESGWWNGVCGANRGWFPSNYVEHVSAEQVTILREAAHLQHQRLPSTPVLDAGGGAAPVADVAAGGGEAVFRRGSVDTDAVASAVPPRLRMGRRSSTPHNALTNASEADAAGVQAARPASPDMSVSLASPRGPSASTYTAEPVRVAQWESRVTLDGRTYFCNIFTDRTAWDAAAADGASSSNNNSAPSRGAELVGDEATLVYVALVMGQARDAAPAPRVAADGDALGHVLGGAGAWAPLGGGVALAAFALAAAAGARSRHDLVAQLAHVVRGVKRLLLAAAPGGCDGPVFRSHRLLRDGHRAILQHVSALTLSAKVASTVWPPPDAADAVHADVAALVRAVRRFVVDAESAGVPARAAPPEDDAVALLPGIDHVPRARPPQSAAKRLSTLQRNEHTGATVVVKPDAPPAAVSASASAAAASAAVGESLFARDRTGIRQRLRQHLAEHHQRTNGRGAAAPALPSASPAPANAPAPLAASPAPAPAPPSASSAPATADVLLQLDEGTHELARVILALDRYLRKVERFYADDASPAPLTLAERSAADARLVAYAKHLVAALAVLLQVLDDLDAYCASSSAAAADADVDADANANANAAGSPDHAGPTALVLSTMDALRACRAQASDSIGCLVAATQDFADRSLAYAAPTAAALSASADDDANNDGDEVRDPEIPTEDVSGSAAERVLVALAQIADALQALNHSAMALHISAKRVVEACDICDLRVLWLRVAKYHVPPSALASVPAGPSDMPLAASSGAAVQPPPRLGFRRSSSLPHLRRAVHSHAAASNAAVSRPRADTIDASDGLAPHLARRAAVASASASPDHDSAVPLAQAVRDARAKDKLNRFFGDDPSHFAHSRRPPPLLDDLTITPVSSLQLGSMSRTPTRNAAPDESAASIMSSRSSNAPSTKALSTTVSSQLPLQLQQQQQQQPQSQQQDQIPWYLSYDSSPEDLLLTNDGQVKGSTLPALVERLVAHDVSDPNF
ncbi:hypothetical protein GGI02_002252, partial [Coemansia sp. RSA 2322]